MYSAGLLTTDTSVDKVNEEACVGIMIGVDNPNMQNGVLGYTAGARLANPDTEILTGIVGSVEIAKEKILQRLCMIKVRILL